MDHFAKLSILAESSILDVRKSSEFGPVKRCIFIENSKCGKHPSRPCIHSLYDGRVVASLLLRETVVGSYSS